MVLNSDEEISDFDRTGTINESAKSERQLKSMLTQSDVLNIAKLVTKDIKELFTSELGSEQMLEGDKSPNSPTNDIEMNDEMSHDGENSSAHNNMSIEAKNARAKAEALLNSMNNKGRQSVTVPLPPTKGNDRNIGDNDGMFHLTPLELQAMIEESKARDTENSVNKKRKLNSETGHENIANEGPVLGAFGAIKNRSSMLAMNRSKNHMLDWSEEEIAALHPRLLKSGLNRTYNDLVVHELIWPNDLVLRGSERIKLLEMTPAEFSQAVMKTVLGTLPQIPENKHTDNLLNYFATMFRDTKDDAFAITLKAHKTVMGQLEKGELNLESDWHNWDEVRKHSMLTQTLQNLTSKTKVTNNASTGKSSNNNQASGNNNNTSNSQNANPKTFLKPCTFYNLNKCRQQVDHGDKFHADPIWLHVCSYCYKVRKDKACHSDLVLV